MNETQVADRARDLAARLRGEGRADDALIVESLLAPGDARTSVLGRVRAPQDLTTWPPGLEQEAVEKMIDARCGCEGRHACDCVSVVNATRSQAWHDRKEQAAEFAGWGFRY